MTFMESEMAQKAILGHFFRDLKPEVPHLKHFYSPEIGNFSRI